MAISAGTQIGPYEIVAPIGAGAMGEVYRAKDARLGREVAVKVLPPALSSDPDRLRRFEQEARAAGMLNHPNILAIYDIGTYEGSPYLVSELLQGETLRDRLGGAGIGLRKTVDYALQIARGLAAAHEKGITHRDLKPENIFITKDGRAKILDFGLAKLTRPEALGGDGSNAPTIDGQTQPGAILGTVGYMSPEQVRGQPVDHRSDLFTFGAILYEMISGRKAFRGASAVETMNAILKEEPEELSAINPNSPPALERNIRHCLEKNPEERFQSARDVAFDLEALLGALGPTTTVMPVEGGRKTSSGVAAVIGAAPEVGKRRLATLALAGVALLALYTIGVGFFVSARSGNSGPPSFHLLTFRRGTILSARFAPDGQTIVYGARWDGSPFELFSTRPESPESRSLGFPGTEILAISPSGEMAISSGRHPVGGFVYSGTLGRASLAGGASREVLEDVQQADWAPNGSSLAVVRNVGGRNRIEFPVGKILYETAGWIGNPRVSPQGDLAAFIDHPVQGDDGGTVSVVDLNGKKRILSGGWVSTQGLAWSPKGDEVWFTATRVGAARALHAVSLAGKERLVARVAGIMTLLDISRDGRALMTMSNERQGIIAQPPEETKERDLSWLDASGIRDISPDGRVVLFSESGEGGGATYTIYIRKTDGSPAVKIGEGMVQRLSPDGKWALAITYGTSNPQLVLFPTGPGEPKPLVDGSIRYQAAAWFPDGKRVAFIGNEQSHGSRLYRSLYLYRRGELPTKAYRLDLASGKKELWKQFMPADHAGVDNLSPILVTPDGKAYAYTYSRALSDLYLVEGVK
ncbi:MAG: protein kinase [Acidobacteria bacterium]|nr:protein kinase [Acidobacteriota bacterium]